MRKHAHKSSSKIEAIEFSPGAQNGSEELFKALASVSNDMIHVCDLKGRILFANQACERHLGYSVDELVNLSSAELIHPEDLDVTMQDKERLLRKNTPSPSRDIRLVRKDGTHIHVNRAEMLLGFLGKHKYIGVILRNTTILKTSARALLATNEKLQMEIEERKNVEKKLLEKKAVLQDKAKILRETNVALNVLLRKRERDQVIIEDRISANIAELALPYLEKLGQTNLNAHQKGLIHIVISNLNEIASNFTQKLTSKYLNLSPAEIKVANHIRQGKRTKEIAGLLNISVQTVKNHRQKIRAKIGITHKKVGLASYLAYLE